jgi:hypothetical protein
MRFSCGRNKFSLKRPWSTDFFSAKRGGFLQELFHAPLDANDEVTLSYLLDRGDLLDGLKLTHTTGSSSWAHKDSRTLPQLLHYTGRKLVGVNGRQSVAGEKLTPDVIKEMEYEIMSK